MFTFNSKSMERQLQDMMGRYSELPRAIARKHLKAAANRAAKSGVPILRRLTPKGGTQKRRNAVARDARGRFQTGSGKMVKRRGGALRRAAAAKSRYVPRAGAGAVYAVIGYRGGLQSRKAIWLEFGTSQGIKPMDLMDKFRSAYKGPALSELKKEMAIGLERASRDLGRKPTKA